MKQASRFLTSIVACVLTLFTLTTASHATTATISNFSPSFGNVGISVTIYGTNFGTTTGTVKFNGTSATVNSWASNKITVTVPSAATTGLVTVTPHNGTAVNSTADFLVLASKAALAMGAFPPEGTNCGGNGSGNGIFDYNGSNCIGDYLKDVIPNVDGVVVVANWSSIDLGNSSGTGPGCTSGSNSSTCTWSVLDTAITNYVNANTCGSGGNQACWNASKKVGIVIAPASDGGCSGNGCNTGTPAWVFTPSWAITAGGSGTPPLDECNCKSYQGDSGAPAYPTCWNTNSSSDISGMPAVWESPFSVALQRFHKHVVEHLNSSTLATYSPYVAYVRLGLSTGGEEYPHCSPQLETLVTPQTGAELETVWTGYANTVFTNASTLGAQYPLMAAPNGNGSSSGVPSDSWADTEAQDALNAGLSLGSEGLQSSDTFVSPCATTGATSGSSSNDWCYTFTLTPTPAVKELQTLAYSDITESVCTTNYFKSTNTQTQNTGSIYCLLPFVEGKANSIEIYPEDVFLGFDSNTTDYGTTDPNTGVTYGAELSGVISNLRAGK